MSQLSSLVRTLKGFQSQQNIPDEDMINLLDNALASMHWYVDEEEAPRWMKYKEPEQWRREKIRLRTKAITTIWKNDG